MPQHDDHIDPATLRALPQSARVPAEGARLVGGVDPDERLELTLRLRRRPDAPALDPGEPISREEFAERYAAARGDVERVRRWASGAGFDVLGSDEVRRTVAIAGTVRALAAAFGTELGTFEYPYGTYRGRTGELRVPAEIADAVVGVFGFDDRRQARPHNIFRPDDDAHPARAAATPSWFTPLQLAQLYDFPPGTGKGETIGIVEFGGGLLQHDLDAYLAALGLPRNVVRFVSVDGVANSPTPPDPTGETPDAEVMLDAEIAAALAPQATIVLYFAPFTERGWVDVISTAVHDPHHRPSIISISWGWPEGNDLWTEQAVRAVDETFAEAAALGVSIFVASGDDGSADELDDGRAHVDFPAASPHVVACGGTTLRAAGGAIASEVVWNDGPRATGGGATGGGVSTMFPLPDWQRDAHVPPSVDGGVTGRGVPDVAADGDPRTGYRVLVRGQWGVVGGTSAVSPLWAGLTARINAALGRSVGYLNPLIYGSQAREAFRDVTQGDNDATGRIGGYAAGPGWDACTGLGTPRGAALLAALQAEVGAQTAGAATA
ncbi:MAG TPA: S53 family peptidase [Gaiellaceae bacterium]|nr:S53 family peptidase [Gaiellaceae bacterium]